MPICLEALSQFNNEGINYQKNSTMKTLEFSLYGFLIFIFLFIMQLGNLEIYSPEEKQKNEKYLIPILVWGPNNMIQGLRESLFMADILGRKVSCNKLILRKKLKLF